MENSAFAGELQATPQRTFKLQGALLFGNVPQPWRHGLPEMPAINPIPSMICEDESRYLHWIARHCLTGEGCVVDLGPLAGGSTHALCSGLALNPAAGRTRVHSYDLWRLFPGWKAFFPGEHLEIGDDLHPSFTRNLLAFGEKIVSYPGDLRAHRWGGDPIEILFIDAAKAEDSWTHILREFIPSCVPGKSLVVHQDWVCAECPWIHLTTARLSEYFVPVDSPDGATAAFLLRRPIPRDVLRDDDFWSQPVSTAARRFELAASWMVGWYGLDVQLAAAHYLVMRGHTREALKIVDEVLAHPDFRPSVQYDVDLVRASVHKRGWRQRVSLHWLQRRLREIFKGRRQSH
jgi:hypothetical protein